MGDLGVRAIVFNITFSLKAQLAIVCGGDEKIQRLDCVLSTSDL
jgi:hypothetical protein